MVSASFSYHHATLLAFGGHHRLHPGGSSGCRTVPDATRADGWADTYHGPFIGFWSWKLRNWSKKKWKLDVKTVIEQRSRTSAKTEKKRLNQLITLPFPRKTDNRPALQRKGSSSNPGPFLAGEVLVLGSVYPMLVSFKRGYGLYPITTHVI